MSVGSTSVVTSLSSIDAFPPDTRVSYSWPRGKKSRSQSLTTRGDALFSVRRYGVFMQLSFLFFFFQPHQIDRTLNPVATGTTKRVTLYFSCLNKRHKNPLQIHSSLRCTFLSFSSQSSEMDMPLDRAM